MPTVAVCERRYVVNVAWPGGEFEPAQPRRRLPGLLPPEARPLPAAPGEEMAEFQRVIMPGPKTRDVANIESSQRSGLTGPTGGMSTSAIGFSRSTPPNMSFAPAQ